MRIGVDIEEVRRFLLKRDDAFLSHAFTEAEMEYAYSRKNPAMHLCGFFCAKEALLKAICPTSLLLREIEVRHEKNGRPAIFILKKDAKLRRTLKTLDVSISHTENYAIAFVAGKN